LFYVYLRHRSNPIAFLVISLAAIPVAVVSNFVRVVVLVLVTYHFGDLPRRASFTTLPGC
jgi:exosortase/archaeosortase family protein